MGGPNYGPLTSIYLIGTNLGGPNYGRLGGLRKKMNFATVSVRS